MSRPLGIIPWNKGRRGHKHPHKGVPRSLSSRRKQSHTMLGYKQTKEHRENNRQAQMRRFPNFSVGQRKIRRKARQLENGGLHSRGEWESLKAQYNWTCPSCGKREPEVQLTRDHIVAISKGGSDNIENIQPLCRPCNSRKHDKDIRFSANLFLLT